MRFLLIDREHDMRAACECAIRTTFHAEYGADVPSLPPLLAALFDVDGAILCATGLRFAEHGFFSECYLERPVEVVLAREFQRPVARRHVVEFSNLACFRAGLAMQLVQHCVGYSLATGARFGIFTATRRLRALVRRSGYGSVELAQAVRERALSPDAWGTYYLHDPRVMAVQAESLPAMHVPNFIGVEESVHA
jgi:hypothetical protein